MVEDVRFLLFVVFEAGVMGWLWAGCSVVSDFEFQFQGRRRLVPFKSF